MVQDGITIDYTTPVLGYPWKIPFEFPTYQIIVASSVKFFNTNLDATGRVISLVLFYSIIFFILSNSRFLGSKNTFVLVFCLLINPIYLYWSRTFLIESTALFFSLAFAINVVYYLENEKKKKYLFFIFMFGLIASLTKITTFLSFSIFLFSYSVFSCIESETKFELRKKIFVLFLLGTIIATTYYFWNLHCDERKNLSILGKNLTANSLLNWNFGTIEDRLNFDKWVKLIRQSCFNYVFGIGILLLGLIKAKKMGKLFWSSIFAGLVSPFIFFNLYLVHDYYHYANTILILIAFVILTTKTIYLNYILATYFIVCLFLYKQTYFYTQHYPKIIPVLKGKECKALTKKDQNIFVIGSDWNSEIPYYAERRAVCILHDAQKKLANSPKELLDSINTDVSLLIVTDEYYKDTSSQYVSEVCKYYNLNRVKKLPNLSSYIYYR